MVTSEVVTESLAVTATEVLPKKRKFRDKIVKQEAVVVVPVIEEKPVPNANFSQDQCLFEHANIRRYFKQQFAINEPMSARTCAFCKNTFTKFEELF